MYALRAKKGKGLRPPPFRELSVSHLTSEDPDQPQTCCHDTHDDVEQEVGDGVLSLLAHFELLSPHYTLCTVCEEKKKDRALKGPSPVVCWYVLLLLYARRTSVPG